MTTQTTRRPRALAAVTGAVSLLLLTACGGSSATGETHVARGGDLQGETLRIAAATELQDLEPLISQAFHELGFDIQLEFPDGTLANSHTLRDGGFDGQFDATWFATNRYADLLGATDKLADSTSIATSPVGFGVDSPTARELGWVDDPPTWADVTECAVAGELTYGMTDPGTSNSGFTAAVAVATALADTDTALTTGDIDANADQLTELLFRTTAGVGLFRLAA